MNPLERLRRRYPWPAKRPETPPCLRGWDGGGRHLIPAALGDVVRPVILEVGSFLGLSARTWLDALPDAAVVCVDPWPAGADVTTWGITDWPELVGRPFYETFLSNCWDHRDRVIPVRGHSPEALREIAACGVRPDLVYLDGDHAYEAVLAELLLCAKLFPDAVLSGDDWLWTAERFPPRSVREAVQDYARPRGLTVTDRGNTWVLSRPAAAPAAGLWRRLTGWLRRAG